MTNKKISAGEAVPWLWLNEQEETAIDDKGRVVLTRNYNNGGPAVFIPPVMQHAQALLAALERALDNAKKDGPAAALAVLNTAGRDAIRKAKGLKPAKTPDNGWKVMQQGELCPICNGTGDLRGKTCPTCAGHGTKAGA